MNRRNLLKSMMAAPLALLGIKPAKPIARIGEAVPPFMPNTISIELKEEKWNRDVYRTVRAGWWSDSKTWENGNVPTGRDDSITVSNPVLMDSVIVGSTIILDRKGQLRFSSRASTIANCHVIARPTWAGRFMAGGTAMSRGTLIGNAFHQA